MVLLKADIKTEAIRGLGARTGFAAGRRRTMAGQSGKISTLSAAFHLLKAVMGAGRLLEISRMHFPLRVALISGGLP